MRQKLECITQNEHIKASREGHDQNVYMPIKGKWWLPREALIVENVNKGMQ